MPSVYKILKEHTDDENPEKLDFTPFWIVAVVRFAQPLTFSRRKMFSKWPGSSSYDANSEELIRERSLLVMTDDVLQLQVDHSKGSYISSLQATIANGPLNYLQEIQPNDWVFAWMFNNESKGRQVLEKIYKGEAANGADEGLKFVGRVQSIRKRLTQSPEGHRTVRYSMAAAGFKELDSAIFYDPFLQKEEQSIGQFLTEMNVNLDDVFEDFSKGAGGLTTTKVIPRMLKLLMGEGIPPESATFGDVQIAAGPNTTKEAPYAYAVPPTVLSLLGQTTVHKQVPSYSDVLELVIGIQKYRNSTEATTIAGIFSPDGAETSKSNHRVLPKEVLGSFLPMPIAFTGKTVWSFLEEFKNPAVNEMYTALRINPQGRIVPTIIVRQLPFSTPYAMATAAEDNLTGHLEVPRWYCDPILINSLDIGKSDALHLNFIHVYGQAAAENGVPMTLQIVSNPPIRDEEDIKRSGLRMHSQTVACSIEDTLDEPRKWMEISADFLIGQQYTLTGTCDMVGVQSPICPGDNFEVDDTVYHIESVSHACAMVGDRRQFNTSLGLTHGMRTDTPVNKPAVVVKEKTSQITGTEEIVGMNSELAMYVGMQTTDALGFDPGQTIDSRDDKKRSNSPDNIDDTLFLQDDLGVLS